jgi:hypothetical protein
VWAPALPREHVIATVGATASGATRESKAVSALTLVQVDGHTDEEPDHTGRLPRPSIPVLVLVGAFAISRLIAYGAGVRYDDDVISGRARNDMYQLLDVHLLKNHLVESVWHLNSQPPLFNLYCGVVLKLPSGWQRPFEVLCALILGLAIVLCSYHVMVALGVPPWPALIVTLIFVVASPAYILFENLLNYAYPTAAFGIFAVWCLIWFLRTQRARFGVGFFGAYGAVVLLNSTYQVEWFLLAGLIVLVVLRHQWRKVLAVAVVPLVLVLGWYVKDFAMFGTTTTSSWLGMNLSRSVLFRAPVPELKSLVHQGILTPLALVPAFGGSYKYAPEFVHPQPNPIPALGELTKANGESNLNNPLYITVSSEYLHDDLAMIRARPAQYVSDVNAAVQVWLVPSDQDFTANIDWPHISPYAAVYDHVVEWQPSIDPAAAIVIFDHRPSPLSYLSIQAIVVYSLALIGGPIAAWRRRRSDPAWAGTMAVMWWTTLYAFAASSLIEIGENERFRFELGPVPLIMATVIVTTVIRWAAVRRRAGAPPAVVTGVDAHDGSGARSTLP